jgi:hypothetical protein
VPSRSNIILNMRCRSSDLHPAQRGIAPFGAIRPFGPGTNSVQPQIGQAPPAGGKTLDSGLASALIAASLSESLAAIGAVSGQSISPCSTRPFPPS